MAHRDPVVVISSSPDFPSICELLPKPTKKPTLRSGSNAAPVPEGAPSAFTTASALRQLEAKDLAIPGRLLGPTVLLPPKPAEYCMDAGPARTKGKIRAAGTTAGKEKTQHFKPKDDTLGTLTNNTVAEAPDKKVARKPRPTKDGAMAQPTITKGKVTKPAAKDAQTKKKPEIVSRHFPPKVSASAAPRQPPVDPIHDEPVSLEPALRRRKDWTPPREIVHAPRLADSSAGKELPSSAGHVDGAVFRTLHDTYGRSADTDLSISTALPLAAAEILGKRKLIEMVTPAGKQKSPEPSPTKPKALKKKPRTITELATAAYRLPGVEYVSADEPRQDSLLGYLETTTGEAEPASKAAGTKRRVSRRPAKPKAEQAKKKEQAPKQLLLSPTSAMRQVAKQDFVFGTASQLATEDDPNLLRALHEAMKASNQPDSDPFISPDPAKSNLTNCKRRGPGLWAAGARYDDGNSLDVNALDLTRSSPLAQALLAQTAACEGQEPKAQDTASDKACIEIEMSEGTLDISNSPPVSLRKQLSSGGCPVSQAFPLGDSSPSVPGRPQTPANEADFEPPPSNQEQHQLLLSQSASPRQEPPQLPPRPNFELYTDARLAKEVASYGFKAVKKRAAMIALLNQCWESKIKTSLRSKTAQVSMSTATTTQAASPLRPTGRPRKDFVPLPSGAATQPAPTMPGRNKCVSASVPGSAPLVEKRPRGRPRKDATGEPASSRHGRKQSASASDGEGVSHVQQRPRGRPKKGPVASPVAGSPAKARSSTNLARAAAKPPASVPTTPRHRTDTAKSSIEIPNSDTDDLFASTPASSGSIQDDIFSSPPVMDLSVTEDTESSLMVSPTSQQVGLFRYITQAVVSGSPTKDPANPSWHEKMLMYDPIVLEDLTAWLNSGQLDRVGYDGEVAPGDVKKWCESKSVLVTSSCNLTPLTTLSSVWSRSSPFPRILDQRRVGRVWEGAGSQASAEPRAKSQSLSFRGKRSFLAMPTTEQGQGEKKTKKQPAQLRPSATPAFHEDGPAYRLAAIREMFEESGILLARKSGGSLDEGLLQVPDDVREAGRKLVYGNQVRFTEWLESQGGEPDVENLIPFTRWITPYGPPKRFTTQMYLYMLPLLPSETAPSELPPLPNNQQHSNTTAIIPTPTHDGGLEHTAATFDDARTWLARARSGDIILFPPQFYLLHLVSDFLQPPPSSKPPPSKQTQHPDNTLSLREYYQSQREVLLTFLRSVPTSQVVDTARTDTIPWPDKVMSPTLLFKRKGDGRLVLGLDKPGPELKDSSRGGDWERVVLVDLRKEGPGDVEVRGREEVLREENGDAEGEGAKL
ncbi:hypothetical protein N657DRAFT_563424 [Parathielavia appendiculata]|uniref:Structure-specific endonuclease subunit SLX4 n=1 Tax=Parathielavia appendiculata TaxID=2587402 RepID=A0AAN6UC14_9PEZI|nr:hypothetical protein N657DRAFT_563424 [Parathielavia appendiculata]